MKKYFIKSFAKRLILALIICAFVFYCFYPLSFTNGKIPKSALEKGEYYFNMNMAEPLRDPSLSEIPSADAAKEMMQNYRNVRVLLRGDRSLGGAFIIIVYGDSRYYITDTGRAGETDHKTIGVIKLVERNGVYKRRWTSRGIVPAEYFKKLTDMYKDLQEQVFYIFLTFPLFYIITMRRWLQLHSLVKAVSKTIFYC